jgi:hypothetical protein
MSDDSLRDDEIQGLSRRSWRARPLFAGAFAVALAAIAFTLPAVRATAREFLDLFRVQRFAAVPVDTERLARLEQQGMDLKSVLGPQIEVLEQPVKPEDVDGTQAASEMAGIDVRQPRLLPEKTAFAGVAVGRPGAFRVRLDVAKLRSLAEVMGADPAQVPDAWEGTTVEIHAPPVVILKYRRGDSEFVLLQSRVPSVELPPGLELAQLGELGLQMSGMSPAEARLFARTIDWRSTLLVPIPAAGGNFREVEVRGRKGLMVTGQPRIKNPDGSTRPGRWRSVLLWADPDRVYAAAGPSHGPEILQMAESIE